MSLGLLGLSLTDNNHSRVSNIAPVFAVVSPANTWASEADAVAYILRAFDADYLIKDTGDQITEDGESISESGQELSYAITGGDDAALFDLVPQSDPTICHVVPDHSLDASSPEDVDLDGVYDLEITVTDAAGAASVFVLALKIVDSDAWTFISNASITDGPEKSALSDLVVDFKAGGLWTNLVALWPFVGSTAAKHKWNLKDPRDLDAAYRLVFSGGWTHGATGANPNGTDSHADTKFLANSLPAGGGAFGVYVREDSAGGYCEIGSSNAGGMEATIYASYDGSTFFGNYGTNSFALTAASTDSRGLWTCGRIDGSTTRAYRNETQIATNNHAVTLPAVAMFLGARNANGSAQNRSPSEIALGFVFGAAWSGALQTALNTAIVKFQTALGRNV